MLFGRGREQLGSHNGSQPCSAAARSSLTAMSRLRSQPPSESPKPSRTACMTSAMRSAWADNSLALPCASAGTTMTCPRTSPGRRAWSQPIAAPAAPDSSPADSTRQGPRQRGGVVRPRCGARAGQARQPTPPPSPHSCVACARRRNWAGDHAGLTLAAANHISTFDRDRVGG